MSGKTDRHVKSKKYTVTYIKRIREKPKTESINNLLDIISICKWGVTNKGSNCTKLYFLFSLYKM